MLPNSTGKVVAVCTISTICVCPDGKPPPGRQVVGRAQDGGQFPHRVIQHWRMGLDDDGGDVPAAKARLGGGEGDQHAAASPDASALLP